MGVDHLMAIASVTKVYTAALILDLAAAGVLSLDDPLTRWVPDAANADGVTLRHLLTHTSGVASDDPALPRVCDPGTCYSYSNAGYGYLGKVVETASGTTYAAQLRGRILAPLHLASTWYPPEETAIGDAAIGYLGTDEALATDVAADHYPYGWLGASGGIVATADQVARFGHALFTGSVLPEASLAELVDFEATADLPGTTDCGREAMLGRGGGPLGQGAHRGEPRGGL